MNPVNKLSDAAKVLIGSHRADFLMALGMLSGADMNEYKQNSFTDVSSTSAAMPYIEWAVQNKIVQGIGNNKFAPDSPITREQMAVMMAIGGTILFYRGSLIRNAGGLLKSK
ncbi:hypothetical protein Back11_39020 [Paenibacillus baekrokdamisoli]|uniref:Uncharacterized protein n=1 Tax=Paenibacillus baekrokdamisoli TaxID=1712516 RepID=A0A3G9IUS3_9BACL|nr:S-layer homology domain-containing protein [Paenibacillus baekrokdamisoli]MBB3068397.1 hypothetical protein [Paenibacillus baekrokdamisoli]BBH22557.1 hypothetical protein Back11_39020 [Paenibacillus baekrokdamisoli]